jgi:hypothetical protein
MIQRILTDCPTDGTDAKPVRTTPNALNTIIVRLALYLIIDCRIIFNYKYKLLKQLLQKYIKKEQQLPISHYNVYSYFHTARIQNLFHYNPWFLFHLNLKPSSPYENNQLPSYQKCTKVF